MPFINLPIEIKKIIQRYTPDVRFIWIDRFIIRPEYCKSAFDLYCDANSWMGFSKEEHRSYYLFLCSEEKEYYIKEAAKNRKKCEQQMSIWTCAK